LFSASRKPSVLFWDVVNARTHFWEWCHTVRNVRLLEFGVVVIQSVLDFSGWLGVRSVNRHNLRLPILVRNHKANGTLRDLRLGTLSTLRASLTACTTTDRGLTPDVVLSDASLLADTLNVGKISSRLADSLFKL
jgi:hypothetical protein